MDLTRILLRVGSRRPHVLLVPAVGGTAVRMRVEAELTRRGWPLATGPADADLLVVAGVPGHDLGPVLDHVWTVVPAPRARVDVGRPDDVNAALDAGAALLADPNHQRAPADDDPSVPPPDAAHADHPAAEHPVDHHGIPEESAHGGAQGPDEHGGHHEIDHHDGDPEAGEPDGVHGGHGGHGAHGGHGGGMGMPGGLPMADLGPDRDGLTLDRLHVALGPVLPDWPAGLVVRVVLQGDVIQEARAELLDRDRAGVFWDGPQRRAARELDALARLLGVAGWADPAARARRLRDELLAGSPPERVVGRASGLVRRVRRSRTVRLLVRGIPAGETNLAALVEQRLDAVEVALSSGAAPVRGQVAELAGLLVGAELAAARLIVAAVDPETESARVRHG